MHGHTAPDVVPRSLNDVELARLARDSGMRAIVLKNHHVATADRAQLAMQAVPGIEVFGGVVLNRAVGGINPDAVRRMVEMEGGRGRIVWLPTFDAENGVRAEREERPFVKVIREGRLVPELVEVIRLITRYDLVLATGHLPAAESIVVIKAAKAAGVKRILVTHVLSPALHATPEDLVEMVRLGAMLEFVWLAHYVAPTTANVRFPGPSRPPLPLECCVEAIRAVGAEHIVLASDFGQQGNPPPPDGLHAFAAELHQAGISAQQLDLMLRRNPARLLELAAAW